MFLVVVSPPTISEQPNDIYINFYESASFKCTARGFGVIKVVWKRVKHNMPITAEVNEEKSLNGTSSILKIFTIIGYYGGQYYCVAENVAGKVVSRTANLHVQGKKKRLKLLCT